MNKSYSTMGNYTLVNTDNGIRKIETSDNVSEFLLQENRVEAIKTKIKKNKDTICQSEDMDIKHKENKIEAITNALMAMIITVFISICTCANIPFLEFMVILSTLEISELIYLIVGCIKEKKRYKLEKEMINQLNEENITLNNQLSKEVIILRSLSKHKEDDSRLNTKEIDLEDQKRYLNSLIKNEETVKIKQKSRFKK